MDVKVVFLAVVTTTICWRSLRGRLSERKLLRRYEKRLDSRRQFSANECKRRNNRLQTKQTKRKRKKDANACLRWKRVMGVARACHHNLKI